MRNCISVTVEEREHLLQKWGLIKVEKKGKKETPGNTVNFNFKTIKR
jgi:hypothetical protein